MIIRRGIPAVVIGLLASAGTARADRIELRGGGHVRGKVTADPTNPDRVLVIMERGKLPLSLQRAQVTRVDEEPGPLDGYVVRRRSAVDTAQAQFDLAGYCEQNRLPHLARLHYETALKLDKNFGPAHEKLGHVLVGEKWLDRDEVEAAKGMVKVRGKWVTPEQRDEQLKVSNSAAEKAGWTRRVRVWRDAVVNGPEDRRREAEARLLDIQDPAAIGPLVKNLGGDDPELRRLLAKSLGAIPGPEAAGTLVKRLIGESDADVRASVMDELQTRPEPEVVKGLTQALRSKESQIVNRAAWALGNLKASSSVPALVAALVTTRTYWTLDSNAPVAGEGPAISASFGGGYNNAGYLPGAPAAYNGSSIAYLTPPTVGPGVVAFGATSAPAYSVLNPSMNLAGGGATFGAGPLSSGRGPQPRLVSDSIQNTEVLAALKKLTGEDFGYELTAWKRWLRDSFQPDPAPRRLVPQP